MSPHHLPRDSAQFKLFWCLLLDKKSPGPDALFQQVIDKPLCLRLPFRKTRRLLITFRTSLLIASPIGDLRWNPITTTEHCLCLRFSRTRQAQPNTTPSCPNLSTHRPGQLWFPQIFNRTPSCPSPQRGDQAKVVPHTELLFYPSPQSGD